MFTLSELHGILQLQLKLNGRTHKDNISIALTMSKVTHSIWKELKLITD